MFSPMLVVVVVILLVQVLSVRGGYEKTCTSEDANRMKQGRVCGSQLSSMLSYICTNGYNKRSGSPDKASLLLGSGSFDFDKQMDDVGHGSGNVFLPKSSAISFLHSKRRLPDGRQGITCECCIYQCTMQELQQYCIP